MPGVLEYQGAVNPITALGFVEIRSETLLFAAEGPFLRVFDHSTGRLLVKTQIFNSQCIHGIATQGDGIATQGHGIATQGASDESSKCRVRSVLIWGGRSVRVASTFFSENAVAGHDTLRISCAGPETHCSDWILDGAISPYDPHRDESLPSCMVAVLVTAHDELLICKLQCDQRTTLDGQVQVETLVAGPRSVLYSAHVLWISVTQVLVAAGTVFGEVHLWSFRPKGTLCGSSHPAAHLHHTFQGHEGSIFGVQISSELRFPGSACPQRLLASCSDDRRIRIWRVPNLASTTPVAPSSSGQGSPETCESETLSSQTAGGEIQPKHCVASAWGHASRIWSVHFVPQRRESWLRENNIDIISTGEDATAQRWSLSFPLGTLETSKSFIGPDAQFKHVSTWDCHSGKNIWSAALTAQSPSSCVLVTGGADGMVVSHKIPSEGTTVTYDYASTSISENATANTRGYELPNNGLYNCDQPTSQWEDPAEGPEHKNAFKKPLHLQYQLQALRVKRFKASDLSVDVLKRYVFVDEGHFLVTTEAGQVFVGILRHAHNPDSSVTWQKLSVEASAPFTWTLIARYDDLKSHSILTSVSSYKVAFLGGTNGTLHVYDHESGAIQSFSILRQKISGLFAQLIERPDCTTTKEARVVGLVATTLGSSTAYSSLMQRGKLHGSRSTVSTVTSWKVELPSTFVVTSAQFILSANSLLLGFRNGTLAAYGLTSAGGSINPSACFRRVHGEDAITVILALPQPTGYSEATTTYVLTAGRNGTYSIHRLYSQHDTVSTIKMRLETVHVCAPPIRPNIEGACFHAVSSNLILWGFRGKDFVVWNETKQSETMTIGCGGAHRNWAYLANENEGGSFMWTKASCLNMQWQPQPSYRVIKEGAHGREIKALAISHRLELSGHRPVNLMVTGAEDTNLSFFTLQENAPSRNCSHFRCFGVLKKHKTGVQHLQWCGSAGFLFSGGGTEEFFVWKARAVPCYGIGMVCESECPLLGDIPDLRIMSFHVLDLPPSDAAAISNEASFLVCIVYSDSTIRVYLYTSSVAAKKFNLLLRGVYTTCCLIQVHCLVSSGLIYLVTAGTDGYLTFWNLVRGLKDHRIVVEDGQLRHKGELQVSTPGPICWQARTRVHQSAVKCMEVVRIDEYSYLFLTGGDDNALAITRVTVQGDADGPQCSILLVPKAHASAITAITFVDSSPLDGDASLQLRFATSSNDQKIKLWSANIRRSEQGVDGLDITKDADAYTSVADVSSMAMFANSTNKRSVLVCGVGMDVWNVDP